MGFNVLSRVKEHLQLLDKRYYICIAALLVVISILDTIRDLGYNTVFSTDFIVTFGYYLLVYSIAVPLTLLIGVVICLLSDELAGRNNKQ